MIWNGIRGLGPEWAGRAIEKKNDCQYEERICNGDVIYFL
jgi:hypothetical protein